MSNPTGKDYFADWASAPVPRELQVNGVYKTVWFRRISAAERIKLNAGVKFKGTSDGGATFEMDQGDNLRRAHLMVHFSVVNEDGTKVFRTVEQVGDIPEPVYLALSKAAAEVNAEDTNEGKESSKP